MKYLYKLGFCIAALASATSCVDPEIEKMKVDKPESIVLQEEINAYSPLKNYVDKGASPTFNLGAGVSVSNYLDGGVLQRLVNTNFDELAPTAGMNHGAVVQDNGSMIFSSVNGFLSLATEAGLSVYGQSLITHTGQNAVYLNSMIADKEVETDPEDANNALHISVPTAGGAVWDAQLNYILPTPLTQGVEYTLKLRVQASSSYTVAFWRYDGTNTNYGPDFAAGETWGDATVTFTPTINATTLQFNFGTFSGDLYFDDMVLTASGSEDNLIANGSFESVALDGWEKPSWHAHTFLVEPVAAGAASWWTNLVTNSDVESDDVTSYFATEIAVGPNPATIGAPGTGADGVGRAIVVQSGDNPEFEWDTQFFVQAPRQLQAGQAYRFSMKVKADKAATISSQAHNNPGGYVHYEMVGSPNVTTEWKEYTNSGIITATHAGAAGMNTIAFNLAILPEANTYYFDDIVWEIEEIAEGNMIPLTPEEKDSIITAEMERWIVAMVDSTKATVKVREVVARPMDDANPTELRTGGGNENLPDGEFYWQDYLGEDYAVTAFKLAREHGNEGDVLFISDNNLASNLDKCQGLIEYVDYIETNGATVDGIATQMRITVNTNKDNIVEMFEMLAATGKFVKITELDVALAVSPELATDEDYQEQKEMYQFVAKQYKETVPPAQRYGISILSPGGPGAPWTPDHSVRKPAYAGFADGLGVAP